MEQRLTIRQIAELAGVSVGTVDRVLHNRGRVSPEAAAAIQSVLDSQSYKYNLHASAVAFKKTKKTLWIVIGIPFSRKGEYWDLVKEGFEKALTEYSDFSIKSQYVFFDQFNALSCKEAFETIATLPCSAVILGTTFVEETKRLCDNLTSRNIPFVFVDGNIPNTKPVACYMTDQQACGRLLAHLIDCLTPEEGEVATLLPRRVGTTMSNNSTIRMDAIRSYFEETGGKTLKEFFFPVEETGSIKNTVTTIIRENPKIKGIAVVISAGYLISDAMAAAGIHGIRVGGFDVTEENARCVKEGTLDFLIDQHPEEQAFNAVQCLLHYLMYGTPDTQLKSLIPINIVFKENLP